MKKIGAVTFVRNTAPYIVPHLRMYKGVHRNIAVIQDQGVRGYEKKTILAHYPESPDGAEELIKKHCPGIEVVHTGICSFDAELFNFGIGLLKDCDYVVFFHADVIFSDADWDKICSTIENGDVDLYKMDMPKCWIDYYYDFDHGLKDCRDTEDIVIAKPFVRLGGMYSFSDYSFGILTGVTGHHFNGWKGYVGQKGFVTGEKDNGFGDYCHDNLSKNGDNGRWFSCPQEIRNKFKDTPHICPDQS